MSTTKPLDEHLKRMKELLLSGEHSDFTIKCHGEIHKVHKAIICPRSAYVNAATRFGKEAEEKSIDLVDDEPGILKLMIQYFYELDYHPPKQSTPTSRTSETPSIRFEVTPSVYESQEVWEETFAIGIASLDEDSMKQAIRIVRSKWHEFLDVGEISFVDNAYVITSRYAYAGSNTRKQLLQLMDFNECRRLRDKQLNLLTHAKIYVIADKYQVTGLKELAIQKFTARTPHACFGNDDFEQAAKLVFENTLETDLGLRRTIADLAQRELEKKGMTEGIQRFLESVPELAVRMLALKHPPKQA